MRLRGALAVGALLVLVACAFGVPALLVPGVGLLLVAAAAWVSVALPRRSLELSGPVHATVQEGQPVSILMRLRGGPLPLLGGELITFGGETRRLGLRVARERWLHSIARPARRGRRTLRWGRLRSRDPFGLIQREIEAPTSEVLVLPRVEPVRRVGAGGPGGAGAIDRRLRFGAEPELDSIHSLPPEAPASLIHWPSVARTGELMGRTGHESARGTPMLVLDAEGAADEDALDSALRAAASLIRWLGEHGGCQVLLPGERRPRELAASLIGWADLHAALALVEPGALVVARAVRPSGPLLWVCGRADGVPDGLRRSRAAERCLVTPFPRSGRSVSFTVAECAGQWMRGG